MAPASESEGTTLSEGPGGPATPMAPWTEDDDARAGLRDYWTARTEGYNRVRDDGSNEWIAAPDRDHAYLVERMPRSELARIIEDLMVAPPE